MMLAYSLWNLTATLKSQRKFKYKSLSHMFAPAQIDTSECKCVRSPGGTNCTLMQSVVPVWTHENLLMFNYHCSYIWCVLFKGMTLSVCLHIIGIICYYVLYILPDNSKFTCISLSRGQKSICLSLFLLVFTLPSDSQ